MRKILLLFTLVILLTSCSNNNASSTENIINNVLIEKTFINFAWGFQYHGTIILENGDIYSINVNEKDHYNKIFKLTEDEEILFNTNELLLNSKVDKKGSVKKKDLEKIKNEMKLLEETYTEPFVTAYDSGGYTTNVFDYSKNKIILLEETGDWEKKNTSESAKKIIEIVNKYIKEYY